MRMFWVRYVLYVGKEHAQVIAIDNMNGTYRLGDTNVDVLPLLR
jgi:hypothetical protein